MREKGAILLICLIVLAILTLLGTSALKSSVTESFMVKNGVNSLLEFYNVEAALIEAVDNGDTWFDSFLNKTCESAYSVFNSPLKNDLSVSYGKIEIRCIDDKNIDIKELSDDANNLPIDPHLSEPFENSGLDSAIFKIRKYGITVTSPNKSIKLQAGIWRAFKDDGTGAFSIPNDIEPHFNIYYWRQIL